MGMQWFMDLSWNQKTGLFIMALSLLGLLLIPFIHEAFNPPEPKNYGYTMIWKIPMPNVLIYGLVIALGIGWILHGPGFALVKT